MQRLNEWLSTLLKERGADLFRSKGILSIHGSDDRWPARLLQPVHKGCECWGLRTRMRQRPHCLLWAPPYAVPLACAPEAPSRAHARTVELPQARPALKLAHPPPTCNPQARVPGGAHDAAVHQQRRGRRAAVGAW